VEELRLVKWLHYRIDLMAFVNSINMHNLMPVYHVTAYLHWRILRYWIY